MEFKGTKDLYIDDEQQEGRITLNGESIDVWYFPSSFEKEEAEANAKLIAAAPQLLSNLIRCVDRLEENGMGDIFAVKKAKDAINKALN